MGKTVFWSWQSDLDGRVTREVVRFALDEAIKILSADLEEADRPSLTSDTQGVAGTPDIVATILRKIDEAAVFVGDVTWCYAYGVYTPRRHAWCVWCVVHGVVHSETGGIAGSTPP